MRTAGTELFFLDPADCSVVQVGCPTSITGLDSTIEQLETTCLESTARTYEAGLATPGTASFTLNLDPQDASHTRLLELKAAGLSTKWVIGFPDAIGTAPTGTTDSDGECAFVLPSNRTWLGVRGLREQLRLRFQPECADHCDCRHSGVRRPGADPGG
jgi:hypothetical protein